VDGFFEWKAIKGQKAKQPYAIAMKDGSPFGIGGLWENWRDPTSSEWCAPSRSSRRTPTS
jgi:putative SOS response-associated peptidase YedK